jgi:hypothetical protein
MHLLELLPLDKSKKEKVSGDGGARKTKTHTFGDEEAVINAVPTGRVGKTLKVRHSSSSL